MTPWNGPSVKRWNMGVYMGHILGWGVPETLMCVVGVVMFAAVVAVVVLLARGRRK